MSKQLWSQHHPDHALAPKHKQPGTSISGGDARASRALGAELHHRGGEGWILSRLSECSTEFALHCFRLLRRWVGGPEVHIFTQKPWFAWRAAPGSAERNVNCFPTPLLPAPSPLPTGLQLTLKEPQCYSSNHFCL